MAINSTTVFDRVRISCDCKSLSIDSIVPINNLGGADGWEAIDPSTTDSGEIAQLNIMRDAVRDGVGPAAAATMTERLIPDSSDTDFEVADGTIFRTDTKIKIDDEILRITSISGNVINVQRGRDHTAIASHPIGREVFKVVELYYFDNGYIAYEDLPFQHWVIHTLHDIHPDNRWKTLATMMLASDVDEDSDTEKPILKIKADVQTVRRVPAGNTYEYPLDRFHITAVDDDTFYIEKRYARAEAVTVSNFTNPREDPDWLAMEELLHDLSGVSFTGRFDDVLLGDFTGSRNYLWPLGSGNNCRTTLNSEGMTLNYYTNGIYVRTARIKFDVTSDSLHEYDEPIIQEYLATHKVDVPVDGQAIEDSETGGPDSVGRFRDHYFGSGHDRFTRRDDGHIVHIYEDGDGNIQEIPISGNFGRAVDIADLSVATGDTYARFPTGPYIDGVYLSEDATADVDLQLPFPADAIAAKDKHRDYFAHNENDTYKIKLRDWDGNVFFVVQPHEPTDWRIRQKAAAAGEWVSISVPARHLLFTLSPDADISTYKRFDITSPAAGEARVLPLPASDSDYTFRHEDFFGLGTGAFANDLSIQSQTGESAVYKTGSIKILGDTTGFAQIDGQLVSRKSSGTGEITNPQLRIFLFREDDVSDYANIDLTRLYSQWRDVPQPFVHRGRIQKDDVLIPTFYFDDSEDLVASDIDLRGYQFEMTVEPEISLEYNP